MSEPQAIDWRTAPAGLEFDRVIAEALGIEIVIARTADGTPFNYYVASHNPMVGWENEIPPYSTSTDAALTLWPPTMPWALLCKIVNAKVEYAFTAYIFTRYGDWIDGGTGVGDTPALAVCRAWLMSKEIRE
jgi:hypothetical protein